MIDVEGRINAVDSMNFELARLQEVLSDEELQWFLLAVQEADEGGVSHIQKKDFILDGDTIIDEDGFPQPLPLFDAMTSLRVVTADKDKPDTYNIQTVISSTRYSVPAETLTVEWSKDVVPAVLEFQRQLTAD